MKLYRDFATQDELDREYNAGAAVPDSAARMASWTERSARAREALTARLGVPYGPTRAEYLDVFPAGEGAPVHLFVHGGYWRRFTARDFSFVAPPLVEAGTAAVVVNYALCPAGHDRRDRAPGPCRHRLDLVERRELRRGTRRPHGLGPLRRRPPRRHGALHRLAGRLRPAGRHREGGPRHQRPLRPRPLPLHLAPALAPAHLGRGRAAAARSTPSRSPPRRSPPPSAARSRPSSTARRATSSPAGTSAAFPAASRWSRAATTSPSSTPSPTARAGSPPTCAPRCGDAGAAADRVRVARGPASLASLKRAAARIFSSASQVPRVRRSPGESRTPWSR